MSDVPANSFLVPRFCFGLTGLSALICEICWIRKASLAFGSSTWAISVVLAVFFAGLALGSYTVGRWSRTIKSPLRGYAWLELGVGCLALLSPIMFQCADYLYGQLYSSVLDSPLLLPLTRLIMVSLVMLPATTLMGGSLPLFCQQFVTQDGGVARGVGVLYGINTLGAAMGAALCGFWLIPNLGVNASLLLAGVINLCVSLIAFRLSQAPINELDKSADRAAACTVTPVDHMAEEMRNGASLTSMQRTIVAWLFFGIGFVAVGSEVLWARYLSLWMPNTVYTYTLTLSVVLLGIVVGSTLSAFFTDKLRRRATVLGIAQVLGALTVMLVMQLKPEWWGSWFNAVSVSAQLVVVSCVMLIPAILSGLSYPLAISLMVTEAGETGSQTGRMTAINLMGGIAGSICVGFMTLPYWGLYSTLLFVTGLGVAIGLIAWWQLERGASRFARAIASFVAVATWLAIPLSFRTKLPEAFLGTDGTLVDFREGFNANVSVVRHGKMLHLEINRMWQGQNVKNHQIFAAHIPALLHTAPKRVLAIGLGTGQTASSFLVHDIERLDCLEIEDGLVELVREHFDGQWMDDPRVRMIVEDGRNYVTHTDQQYDIISIEVGQIYRPRISSFYSADFYTQLRPKLRPGGLVCQFLPIEFFEPEEFRTLVATFRDVFPQSMLWYNTSELLLIGSVESRLRFDPERLSSALANNLRLKLDFEYAYWGGPARYLSRPESFMAGFLCGPAQLERLSEGAAIYRDDRPYLEYLPLRPQSDARSTIALLQRQLSPLPLLIGDAGPAWLSTAHQMRADNLQEISARVLVAQAQSLDAAGELEAAFNAYQQALQALPTYPKANAGLAYFLHAQGELPTAITFYQRALAVQPNDVQVLLRLSEALIDTGRSAEAQQSLRSLLALVPQHIQANALLGQLLLTEGQAAEAEKLLRQSLRGNSQQPDVLISLGNVMLQQGQKELALEEFNKAEKLDVRSADLHIKIGWAFGQTGHNGDALDYFEKALEIDPKATRALLGQANVWQSMGEKQKAQHAYEHILSLDPNMSEARVGLAFCQQSAGKTDEALRSFTRALEVTPNNPNLLTAVAWILATHHDDKLRDAEQAKKMAEQAWQITGQQAPQAGDALAAAYAALGEFDRAVEISDLAIAAARKQQRLDFATEIEKRKALYEQHKSFTE